MRLRVVDLGLEDDAPPVPRDARRVIEAALRGRLRWLRRHLDDEPFQRLMLLPMLLHGAFRFPGLDSAPPGIERAGTGRGWAARARRFRLPPPHQVCRHQPLVDAVLALPRSGHAVVWVVPKEGLLKGQIENIDRRIEALRSILRPHTLARVDAEALREEGERLLHVLLFGALVSGRLPALPDEGPAAGTTELWSLVEAAPDDRCAEALMEALGRRLPPIVKGLEAALEREGTPALRLADPAEACRLWVGGQRRPSPLDDFEEAHRRGRAAALAAVRGLSRTLLRHDAGVRERVARAFLRTGVPSSWLPDLALRLDPRMLELRRAGRHYEVRDGWGQCIVRAPSEATARVRALHFLAEAYGRVVCPWRAWRRVAEFLAEPDAPGALMLVDGEEGEGSPADPFNRGEDRRLLLTGAVVIRRRRWGRPTVVETGAEAAVLRLIRGDDVQVLPRRRSVSALATRAMRLAAQAHRAREAGRAFAAEVGGEIWWVQDRRLRRQPIRRFARRPVKVDLDPEAPDVTAIQVPPLGRGEILACGLELERAGLVRVTWRSREGWTAVEHAPLYLVERWLEETREHFHGEATVVVAYVAPDLEEAIRTAAPPDAPILEVHLRGRPPFDLAIRVEGEWFGAGCEYGWRAAALAVSSRWPVGSRGLVFVGGLEVEAAPIVQLWARSAAMRRLGGWLRGLD